jgi:hypothetical protein
VPRASAPLNRLESKQCPRKISKIDRVFGAQAGQISCEWRSGKMKATFSGNSSGGTLTVTTMEQTASY